MKPKHLILSALAIFALVIASLSIVCAYTELSSPSSVTGRGTVPFLGPKALLDDFNAGTGINAWNCVTGTFSKSGTTASCTASYTNNPSIVYGGTGRSLQLNYNVNATNSYAGYVSQLGAGSLTSPVAYTAVSFYVRGAAGGEFFKIAIKNNSAAQYFDTGNNVNYYRNEAALYITDYLDGGVTTTWKKVTIPFHNFANLDGWSSMKEFVIVFENSQSVTNGSPTQGTIYIDNIQFETTAVSVVRVDHFGDKLGVCALGGNMGTTATSGTISYSFSNTANEYSPSPYGMRLNYNVTNIGAWAATYVIFGGGNDAVEDPDKGGWIAILHNFNAYNNLYIKVRAKSATENPKEMRIELVDSGGSRAVRINGINDSWQYWRIPMSSFPSLDKTSIKQLTFVFEGYRIGSVGGNKAGAVFIDSVEFDQVEVP